jgi:PAS domain S-box-containing protein
MQSELGEEIGADRPEQMNETPTITPADVGMGHLFWSIADAVVVGDINTGRIVLWNPAAEAMFGYSADETLGQSIELIVAPSFRKLHRAGLARYRSTHRGKIIGTRSAITVSAVRKDGRELTVELTLSAVDWNDSPIRYVLALIRDVTERVETEARVRELNAELELARKKDQFLALVAHELRTPLTVIRGHTQLLHRQLARTGDVSLDRAATIIRKVKELEALISDLLDVSRIESGRLESHPVETDYVNLVQTIAEEMRVLHPERVLEVRAPLEARAMVDEGRLRQVLVNLLDNAFKYGPPDTAVDLVIEVAGDWVTTYVRDQGPPLPPEERDRVFERFYRLRSSGGLAGGLGIGLYICRGIIEAHRGSIWIEDDEHSSFAFTLPVPEAQTT